MAATEVFQNYAQLRAKHAWDAVKEWKAKWEFRP